MRPFLLPVILSSVIGVALGGPHKSAVCVQNRVTGSSASYDIDFAATRCACTHYKNRNTGSKWWDTCPDCHYNELECNSPAGHIGGDEMTYYCSELCGAQGAEGD